MIHLKKGGTDPQVDPDLWDFFRGNRRPSSTDEANTWMQYEYARSSKLIVKAVEAIRRNSLPSATSIRYPAFAQMLAKVFPEFPSISWVQIPKEVLATRLETAQKFIVPAQNPTIDDPVRLYTLKEFFHEVLSETVTSPDTPEGNRFYVVEVNFGATDPEIARTFQNKFAENRKEEIRRFDDQRSIRGKSFNPADYFKTGRRQAVGSASIHAQIRSYLRQLGALRLLLFYKNDWKKGEENSPLTGGNYLFSERKSWFRAQSEAAYLLLRLELLWKYTSNFVSIFDYPSFAHNVTRVPLSRPIPPVDEFDAGIRVRVRTLLRRGVILPKNRLQNPG